MHPSAAFFVRVVIFACSFHGLSTGADPGGAERAAATTGAPTKSVWSLTPDPKLPDVLLLGDSISIGYTLEVRGLLEGQANVFRPLSPNGRQAENCSGTTRGVEAIDRWLGDRKWSVIHFNFGLHDLKHVARPGDDAATNNPNDPRQADVAQYRRNLEVIVRKLKSTGARLVFATTTPVAPETRTPLREPDAPSRYNAVALGVMRSHGIRVNDLYAFCQPQLDRMQQPKNVHFTAAGYKMLAREVAMVIAEELKPRPSVDSR